MQIKHQIWQASAAQKDGSEYERKRRMGSGSGWMRQRTMKSHIVIGIRRKQIKTT